MIPIAAVYILPILAFFFARNVFWASMAVILLVYLIKPQMLSCVGEQVFTNLTYAALGIILVLLLIGIIVAVVAGDRIMNVAHKWMTPVA